jgi:hypothetical protein
MPNTVSETLARLKTAKLAPNFRYQEVSYLVNFCLENDSVDIHEIALTHIVNYGFHDLMQIAFETLGISLLNKLFDPLNKDTHPLTVISKSVFDHMASRMTTKTPSRIRSPQVNTIFTAWLSFWKYQITILS